MASYFLFIKLVHIVSAVMLAGFGLGSLVYFVVGYRSGSQEVMRTVFSAVDTLDLCITTPSGITQLVTGIMLASIMGLDFSHSWLVTAVAVFLGVGLIWIRVVWLQKRMKKFVMAEGDLNNRTRMKLRRHFREWLAHGVVGFFAMATIFSLMVLK